MNRNKLLSESQSKLGNVLAVRTIFGRFSFHSNTNQLVGTPAQSVMYATEDEILVYSKPIFNYSISHIRYQSIASTRLVKDAFGFSVEIVQYSAEKAYISKIDASDDPDGFVNYVRSRVEALGTK